MNTCNWTDCLNELESSRGRPRKWCNEHRDAAARAAKRGSKRICNVDGCRISHRAKGLCTKHYKQTYGNSLATITKKCDGCGCDVVREKRAPRYGNTYCSTLCRHWIEWGAWSQRTTLTDIQAEHVYPLSRGGANNLTNLLPSCGPCNSDKRDLLLHEWAPDRTRRHLPPVNTTWSAADSRYKHLTYRTNLRLSA